MSTKFNMGIPVDFEGFKHCRRPQDVIVFFDDFLGGDVSATAELSTWLETKIGAATGVAIFDATSAEQERCGGWVSLTPEGTDNDCVNLTVNGEHFQLDQGYPIYFETRVYDPDISDTEWWVGLTESDTEIISGGIAGDAIGFECSEAGALSAVTVNGGTEEKVATGDTVANGDIWRLAFYYDGVDTIYFYTAECSASSNTGELVEVDTRDRATVTDDFPEDTMLTPTIEVTANGAQTNDAVYFDYVYVCQPRRHMPE